MSKSGGFTIVELLVVIVVIVTLAAITIVSYGGVSNKAKVASVKSDLANSSSLLKMYYADHGEYPASLDNNCPKDSANNVDAKYCIKASGGSTYTYAPSSSVNSQGFSLQSVNGSTVYSITSNTGISPRPSGFVVVPGSVTYGTSDFCVMQYEAKADDNGDGVGDTNHATSNYTWPAHLYPISATRKLVSTPIGYPVTNVTQNTAKAAAQNYVRGCDSGCHL